MVSVLNEIKPLSPGQELLMKSLKSKNYDIIGVFGPTGTGKSLISCAYGIGSVLDGVYKRFILTRPIVDIATGREYTSLELGDLYYKLSFSYLEDIFGGLIGLKELKRLWDEGKLVIADPHFLRGRTFDESILLFDDVQSAKPETVSELIMRMGRGSKLIIAGDPIFQSLEVSGRDPASVIREVLLGEERALVVDLGIADVVRPGARRGIKLALGMRMIRRELSQEERRITEVAKLKAPDAELVTVLEFRKEKEEFGIEATGFPDALIVVKEGYLGRLVGRGGERIGTMERELGLRLRAVELTLDLKKIVTALHPVGWIGKHIINVDFAGPQLQVTVRGSEVGAFLGQRGKYVRFLDALFKRLMGVGVRVVRT
ncbi:MAG: phosphate starvation-inducible protein PhoH [Thermofilum sp. ex4484_15]|nr:MAG: phosphate starvation-inducible protein PhoH [Thermofilum sp. ex4484_15]